MRVSFSVLAVLAICGLSFGQCSTLTVSGSVNAGQTVSVAVAGASADALTFLVVGDAGSTSIMLPGASLVLGVAEPFALLPLGVTDATGAVSISVDVPANVPAGSIPDATKTVQAVSASFAMGLPPTFSFCVSNTATLVFGNG